jgi:(2Fe-2S) ferredoxin
MLADIPVVFKYHVFTCFPQRPRRTSAWKLHGGGSEAPWERLQGRLTATPNPDVSVTATGCLGFCRAGPLMVVYPEGVWYVPRTEKDIDEILPSHFVEGNPVERLIIVPIP